MPMDRIKFLIRWVLMLVIAVILIFFCIDINKFLHREKRQKTIFTLEQTPRQKSMNLAHASEQNTIVTMKQLHRKEPAKLASKQKYLIYLCDKNRRCGGWGDKMRGIVTAFVYSILLKRKFGLIMTSPCDLRQFYKPNEINWIVSEKELEGKTTKTLDVMNLTNITLDTHFKPYQHFDVLYFKTNSPTFPEVINKYEQQMSSYLQGLHKSRVKMFRAIWLHLMLPTDRLAKHVKLITGSKLSKKDTSNLVCAHLRIGYSKYMPNDRVALDVKTTYKVFQFLDTFKKSRIFLATDNIDVRNNAKKIMGKRYIGSYAPVLNPDSSPSEQKLACRSFEQALVDQLVLIDCDVLLISKSGFSSYAAWLKKKAGNVYLFYGKEVEAFTPV